MIDKSLFTMIKSGANYLSLNLDDYKIDLLVKYLQLLFKWNKTFSLTAISTPQEAVTSHIIDGLSVVKYLKADSNITKLSDIKALDVGSGMGVPGIVMAICMPDIVMDLIDSNHKKSAFLQQCKIELGLLRTNVITKRVENYVPQSNYNLIISRAFADSELFLSLTRHLLDQSLPDSCFITMKSSGVFEEIKRLSELNLKVNDKTIKYDSQLIKLDLPNVLAERFLLKIKIV